MYILPCKHSGSLLRALRERGSRYGNSVSRSSTFFKGLPSYASKKPDYGTIQFGDVKKPFFADDKTITNSFYVNPDFWSHQACESRPSRYMNVILSSVAPSEKMLKQYFKMEWEDIRLLRDLRLDCALNCANKLTVVNILLTDFVIPTKRGDVEHIVSMRMFFAPVVTQRQVGGHKKAPQPSNSFTLIALSKDYTLLPNIWRLTSEMLAQFFHHILPAPQRHTC